MTNIRSPLRWLLWFISLCIVLAIITPIAAWIFFDPNQYKPQIASYIEEKTGLPLTIEGTISLQVFPWVGLNVHRVSLQQTPAFGTDKFIHIEELTFKVPLHELFQRKFKIESLIIKGLDLHLIKLANGTTNWDYFLSTFKNPNKTQLESDKVKNEHNQHGMKKIQFALDEAQLHHARIQYDDLQKHQTLTIHHLDLTGVHNPSTQCYPLTGDFAISLKGSAPSFEGRGRINGKILDKKDDLLFRHANIHAAFNLQLDEISHGWKDVQISSHLEITPEQLSLNDIELESGPIQGKGSFTIPAKKESPISFQFKLNQLSLDELPLAAPKKAPNNTAVPINTANQPKTLATAPSVGRIIKGDLFIEQLRSKNLTLLQLKTTIQKQGNVIKLNPFTANLLDGKISAQITHNAENTEAPLAFQGTLTNIQVQPLLRDLKQENVLTGHGNVDFNITKNPTKGITGSIKAHLKDGSIQGVDINFYLGFAKALFKKENNSQVDTKQTPFNDLSATLNIHDNIIDNNDLLLVSSNVKATGDGSIDLNQKTLSYKLKAIRLTTATTPDPSDIPLAIRVKGLLRHPQVVPDLDVYLKLLMEKNVKSKLENKLEKILKKANEQLDSSNEDEAQKSKLERKLEKGLKKLFKHDDSE
jgi:AsmA protein